MSMSKEDMDRRVKITADLIDNAYGKAVSQRDAAKMADAAAKAWPGPAPAIDPWLDGVQPGWNGSQPFYDANRVGVRILFAWHGKTEIARKVAMDPVEAIKLGEKTTDQTRSAKSDWTWDHIERLLDCWTRVDRYDDIDTLMKHLAEHPTRHVRTNAWGLRDAAGYLLGYNAMNCRFIDDEKPGTWAKPSNAFYAEASKLLRYAPRANLRDLAERILNRTPGHGKLAFIPCGTTKNHWGLTSAGYPAQPPESVIAYQNAVERANRKVLDKFAEDILRTLNEPEAKPESGHRLEAEFWAAVAASNPIRMTAIRKREDTDSGWRAPRLRATIHHDRLTSSLAHGVEISSGERERKLAPPTSVMLTLANAARLAAHDEELESTLLHELQEVRRKLAWSGSRKLAEYAATIESQLKTAKEENKRGLMASILAGMDILELDPPPGSPESTEPEGEDLSPNPPDPDTAAPNSAAATKTDPGTDAARRLSEAADAAGGHASAEQLLGILEAKDGNDEDADRIKETATGALAREINAEEPNLAKWAQPAEWLERTKGDDRNVQETLTRAARRIADRL